MKKNNWTGSEIVLLKKIYKNTKNSELSKIFNRSESSIINKSNKLGLKKSKEHIGRNISNRNKLVGTDWTYENILKSALKCKSRSEFQKKYSGGYNKALKLGVLDDITSHMTSLSFSTPQLILYEIIKEIFKNNKVTYNNRKVISPYEIDVYVENYSIGFEYNGKNWHTNNINDTLKNKKSKEKNIILFHINENNRNYQKDIVSQIINYIPEINKLIDFTIKKEELKNINFDKIYDGLIDINQIKSVVSKYETLKQFRENENLLYQKLIRNKKLELLKNLKKERNKYTINELVCEIEKHKYLLDFIKKSNKYYQYILKNNLNFLLMNLERKN
jgi:hypothetical protein